jgi:UDP-2,4-diacetamido-2,4,6-trideoxy-beta-L-altropyranose hydrolase
MTVLFRVDSSLQIGSGHLMRCLTLADGLRQRGVEVLFVCREHLGNFINLVEGKVYPVARLPKPEAQYPAAAGDVVHAVWLGVPWHQDADDTIAALESKRPDWLIVDHYALDNRWEMKLRPHVGKIMVLDDLADRDHDCDLLLDQNLYREMETRYDTLVSERCKKLLGPRFALLRPEFMEVRKTLGKRSGLVQRILVFFGGVDAAGMTLKTIDALANIIDRGFAVDVVTGGSNPHNEQIEHFCTSHAGFNYHCQIEAMAELMAAADLAIGAGGTTIWERCALGLPSIVTAVAQNQVEQVTCCAERGVLFCLGTDATTATHLLIDACKVFLAAPSALRAFTVASMDLVDARGVQRVVGMIAPPQIAVRVARESDCDAIYQWRNAVETRKYIFNSDAIPLEAHRTWYGSSLARLDMVLLIGEISGKPVGVLRYDLTGDQALISVYLVPGGQGQGTGTELIRCGSRWLKENRPGVKTIDAEIVRENIASIRAFEQAGYQEHHLTYQEVLK